jgi:hypothetical protein
MTAAVMSQNKQDRIVSRQNYVKSKRA